MTYIQIDFERKCENLRCILCCQVKTR